MPKLNHKEKKDLQQKRMLHRYREINELSDGEFFKKLKKLETVEKKIQELTAEKTALKGEIQDYLTGKAQLKSL